ncbi:MAG: imidazole glycerol phosphate synthase subunit HisH [Pseudomonadota bacterium]|jgi:glutamine amidotransferase
MKNLAVIDYGMGNLHSVAKAVEHVAREMGDAVRVHVTSDPQIIGAADRVIFPGVGAIRDCMAEINRLQIGAMVADFARTRPVLAICVGFQALMEYSEENQGVDCLGLVRGQVKFFGARLTDASGQRLKVPHMGWNTVSQVIPHPLWEDIEDLSRFYFVHSYYVAPATGEPVAGVTNYGVDFCSALAKGNIFAVQFHPEKSQTAGLTLLRNFLRWEGGQ